MEKKPLASKFVVFSVDLRCVSNVFHKIRKKNRKNRIAIFIKYDKYVIEFAVCCGYFYFHPVDRLRLEWEQSLAMHRWTETWNYEIPFRDMRSHPRNQLADRIRSRQMVESSRKENHFASVRFRNASGSQLTEVGFLVGFHNMRCSLTHKNATHLFLSIKVLHQKPFQIWESGRLYVWSRCTNRRHPNVKFYLIKFARLVERIVGETANR